MHELAEKHVVEKILSHNEEAALHNKEHFDQMKLSVFNFMSAPGAGKTTLIETTLRSLPEDIAPIVVEGDMVGDLDAQRLKHLGIPVYQISTGRACHLDALMLGRLMHVSDFSNRNLLFIENVGNLVCPAEFPLGEHKRVVLLSVTEGDDKPLKYPVIFKNCDAVVFTKTDLLPYVNFDLDNACNYVLGVNPHVAIFAVSATNNSGMDEWLTWLKKSMQQIKWETKCHVH